MSVNRAPRLKEYRLGQRNARESFKFLKKIRNNKGQEEKIVENSAS